MIFIIADIFIIIFVAWFFYHVGIEEGKIIRYEEDLIDFEECEKKNELG